MTDARSGHGAPHLRRLMFNISTMEELGEVLSSRNHFRENLTTALLSLMGSVPAAHGVLLLHDQRRGQLELAAVRGAAEVSDFAVRLPEGAARALWRQRRPINLATPPSALASWARRFAAFCPIDAAIVAPLRFKEDLLGAVALGRKYTGRPYGPDDDELIMVMANYIAIGVHNEGLLSHLVKANTQLRRKVTENRRLYRNLEAIYADTVRALGAAIDAKDPYTRGHSDRVARIAVAIARALGLPDDQVRALRVASHLHDIGKIAVDNSILLKPGRLDEEEMVQIHRHPEVSYDILSNIQFPYPDVALIARHHHEWVDGSGYPGHLGPERLLPGMKIICLADAFDAMTSDRPYRPALDLGKAVSRIRSSVSVQFDPAVTRAFLRVLRGEVGGEAPEPDIIAGIDRSFAKDAILGSIDSFLADLGGPREGVPVA